MRGQGAWLRYLGCDSSVRPYWVLEVLCWYSPWSLWPLHPASTVPIPSASYSRLNGVSIQMDIRRLWPACGRSCYASAALQHPYTGFTLVSSHAPLYCSRLHSGAPTCQVLFG